MHMYFSNVRNTDSKYCSILQCLPDNPWMIPTIDSHLPEGEHLTAFVCYFMPRLCRCNGHPSHYVISPSGFTCWAYFLPSTSDNQKTAHPWTGHEGSHAAGGFPIPQTDVIHSLKTLQHSVSLPHNEYSMLCFPANLAFIFFNTRMKAFQGLGTIDSLILMYKCEKNMSRVN